MMRVREIQQERTKQFFLTLWNSKECAWSLKRCGFERVRQRRDTRTSTVSDGITRGKHVRRCD